MAKTTKDDMLNPQILLDAILGRFKVKNAFMGSVLVSSGAVTVEGSMPKSSRKAIGKKIEIPYFGSLPPYVDNAEGSAVTPSKIAQTNEEATVARSSLAVENTRWAQGVGATRPELGDPYAEGARQAEVQTVREIDKRIVTAFGATPLVRDVYSASSPTFIDHRLMVNARTLWGDEQDDIVAMVIHSQAEADIANLTDTMGRPLLLSSQVEGQKSVRTFAGIPVLVSDRVPLTGSTMGAVTSAGTSPPVATLAVADASKLGPWNLVIDCVLGGAHQTATYRFSTDGGNTWSATITTLAAAAVQPLVDTAVDSLVGNNGETGLTVAFAAGTFNADNTWKATANLKATSLICQRGAGAFWYSQDALQPKTDEDILSDTDILAMHLYYAAHLYRRRREGTRPGVIAIKHNLRSFIGVNPS